MKMINKNFIINVKKEKVFKQTCFTNDDNLNGLQRNRERTMKIRESLESWK